MKQLYEKGFQRQDILELFRFIDWLLILPKDLNQQFRDDVADYEAAMSTPYITSIERHGIEQGIQLGIEQGIEKGIEKGLDAERALLYRQTYRRFGEGIAEQLQPLLQNIRDTEMLARIGEYLIDHDDGNTLLQQVRALLKVAE